jgi:hypothetical protein
MPTFPFLPSQPEEEQDPCDIHAAIASSSTDLLMDDLCARHHTAAGHVPWGTGTFILAEHRFQGVSTDGTSV